MLELSQLSQPAKNATMEVPLVSSNQTEKLRAEVGKHESFSSDDAVCHYPVLGYEPATSADSDNRINKAFDILFQEVINIRKSKFP